MSNPCINRWGINSFWSHYWYSDLRYSLYSKQDNLILELLKIYLKCGSNIPKTFFLNVYWYKESTISDSKNFKRYYRWVTVRNRTLDMYTTYPMRILRDETFDTRITILRLNSWIVVNSYWFQPDKKKKHRLLKARIRDHLTIHHENSYSHSLIPKIKKLSSLMSPIYAF